MIMGYEKPVEMPTMDIYNTDLMKAYIAGVKDQYDKALDEMKDFMKTYNDFYSPIEGDTQAYHDMTVGGASNLINNLYAHGIDPFKSPEARAAISRYINSVPTGTLNLLKQNAEVKTEYNKAVAKLKSQGKYNPMLELMELEEANLSDFQSIDPITGNVRIWDRYSPIEDKSLYEFALPQFSKYGKTEYLGPGSRPFFDKWGVSDLNQQAATEATVRAIDATPYAKLYRKLAKDEVERRIASSNVSYTTEQVNNLIEAQYRRNILDEMNDYLQPEEKENKVALKQWEVAQSNRQKELDRAQKAYQFNIAHGADKKSQLDNTPWSEQIKRDANRRIADQATNQALNTVDKNGNPISVMPGKDTTSVPFAYGSGVLSIKKPKINTKEDINRQYGNYSGNVNTNLERNFVSELLTGVDALKATGEDVKSRTFYSSKGILLTPVRRANLFGKRSLISDAVSKFNSYLRNNAIKLHQRNMEVGKAAPPKKGGGQTIDVYGYANMDLSDFMTFYKAQTGKSGNDNAKRYAESMGLKVVTRRNATKLPDGTYTDAYEVQIPITRTMGTSPSASYELHQIDTAYEKLLYAASVANNMRPVTEEYSLGNF